jgi:hypothetical protein
MASGGHSTADRSEIERIVRQVLAEIADRHAVARPPGHRADGDGRELVVVEKVVSTKELENRIEGVTRLLLTRGAVVTPAARDLLRERQIAIATALDPDKRRAETYHVVMGKVDTNFEVASLAALLARDGATVEQLPQTGLADVTESMCEHVAMSGHMGVLITRKTAAALCLANRRRGVRAVLGSNVAAVQDAVATLSANFLVVDPEEKATFEWRRLAHAWLHTPRSFDGGELRERLS